MKKNQLLLCIMLAMLLLVAGVTLADTTPITTASGNDSDGTEAHWSFWGNYLVSINHPIYTFTRLEEKATPQADYLDCCVYARGVVWCRAPYEDPIVMFESRPQTPISNWHYALLTQGQTCVFTFIGGTTVLYAERPMVWVKVQSSNASGPAVGSENKIH